VNLVDSSNRKNGAPEVAAQIRRQILDGKYLLSERLPSERSLAEQFGCARGTLREALNKLDAAGLVKVKAGSGTYVLYEPSTDGNLVIDQARPLELIDARFALEPHICRLAVLQATTKDLNHAEHLVEIMEGCGEDMELFAKTDTEFHTHLAETTRNSLLIWVISQISNVRTLKQWDQMRVRTLNSQITQQYNIQHRNVLEAIRARDPERAANAMKDHLETARLSLTRAAST
jgi:DNA-binding FadR family transcriptional regulator